MALSLTFDECLEALARSGAQLAASVRVAGLSAPVPTCPDWTTGHLVAHVAMVHRWSAAQIRGEDPDAVPTDSTIREGVPDLVEFYEDGLEALLAALRDAPPDLEAFTFLKDPPTPREFWARRQAHETTIHMVDARAAELGRVATASETAVSPMFAADGIDELLRGFFTRGKSKLYDNTPFVVEVSPTDVERRWVLRVDERLTVDPGDADAPDADARLISSAAALYLALWNRGDEIDVSGRPDVLDRWRETQRVTWS